MMSQEPEGMVVEHDPAAEQFRAEVEGSVAVLQYRREPGKLSLLDTQVPPALQGRGIAGRLAQAGLELARTEGLAVVPICPFVAEYIRRHPEYETLLDRR
jgi:predicted GNAT family acetyltransferase